MSDSIVVMEGGSRWPAWVDRQAGATSNVAVLAQQSSEQISDFCARTLSRLDGFTAVAHPARAVLVCSAEHGAEHSAARECLLFGLLALVARAGGGQVVLVADGDSAQRFELAALATELNDLLDEQDAPVAVMFRAAPRTIAPETAPARAPAAAERRVA